MNNDSLYSYIIEVAGCNIHIKSIYPLPEVFKRFKANNTTADFCVQTSPEDIDFEREEYRRLLGYVNRWDGFYETKSLNRMVAEELITYNAFLFHGAAIAIDNHAYIFTAPSGTGKTTHILKWLEQRPDSIVINGDKPFIRFSSDSTVPHVCGSPWAGKENLCTNIMVPLKAIIVMERNDENSITQISFTDAFIRLLQQTYHPKDECKMRKTLKLMQLLSSSVAFWNFKFNNFKEDCFSVVYNAIHG